ncbi:hypothetical protein DOY81_014530, partial [Sarcophaga bullata]
MIQCSVGIDYLTEDCFEVTQLLVAILLGSDEVPQEVADADGLDNEEKPTESVEPTLKEESCNLNEPSVDQLKKSPSDEEVKAKEAETNESKAESTAAEDVVLPAADDEIAVVLKESSQNKELEQLGTELAFKIQTRYHLDAIVFYSTVSGTYDSNKLATHLHALYSQTCNINGRHYTVEVLGLNNQLQVFMDLIKHEQRLQAQRQLTSPGAKYKSPVLSYAV